MSAPSMTKQHFAYLAEIVREQMSLADSDNQRENVTHFALVLSFKLAATNQSFDRERFLIACGVE